MAQVVTASTVSLTGPVSDRLRNLRFRIATWFVVDGLSRLLLCLLLLIGIDLLIDWLFHMDRAQRIVMLVLAIGILVVVLYRRIIRPLSQRVTDDALCLEIEDQNKQLGQSLISAVQFSRMEDFESRGISTALVRATIDHGMLGAEKVAFEKILRADRFVVNLILLAVTVLALIGVGVSAAVTNSMAIWFDRNLMLGHRQWPQDVFLAVEGVQDGQLRIPRGDDCTVIVAVTDESRRMPTEVLIDIRSDGAQRSESLEKSTERRFQTTFMNVIEEFEFRARSKRVTTPWYAVRLVDRPAVEQLYLELTPPKYAGQTLEQLPPGKGPYYVLKGSSLRVQGTANKALSDATLSIGKHRYSMDVSDGAEFHSLLTGEQLVAGVYRIELTDTEQILLPGRDESGPLKSKQPTSFTLKIRKDREPQVRAKLNGISTMVVRRARIPFDCRVNDDYAVSDVRLSHKWRAEDDDKEPRTGVDGLEQLQNLLNRSSVSFQHAFELSPLRIPAGSQFSFVIEADDNDNISGPKTGRSTSFLLRVVGEDELRTDLLRREKEQRQEFERYLKQQEDILTDCDATRADIRGNATLDANQRGLLAKTQKRQKLLGTNLAGIAQRFENIVLEILNNKLEAEDGDLLRRLRGKIIDPIWSLVDERIPSAAKHLDQAWRQSSDPAKRNQSLTSAIDKQREITATMREILRHMVKAEGFQEAVNLLFEIQREQKKVLDETDKKKQDRIREILQKGGSVPKGNEGR